MATIRCENGHYYDGAKFAQCPHCGVLPVIQKENSSFTSNKGGFFKKIHFGRKKPEPMPEVRVEEEERTVALEEEERTVAMTREDENDDTEFYSESGTVPPAESAEDDEVTISYHEPEVPEDTEDDEVTISYHEPEVSEVSEEPEGTEDDEVTISYHEPEVPEVPEEPEGTEDDEVTISYHEPEVSEVPEESEDTEDEVTISYHEPEVSEVPEEPEDTEDDDVTISYREPEEPENPQKVEEYKTDSELEVQDYVAGWLVGIEGSTKGMDYRIVQGFNRMVIASNGKIEVKGVAAAADRAMVLIVYDNRKNQFFVLPQQDEIQLNGTQIQSSTELHSGNEIEFLQEKFEFVAFCREGRVWKADAQ